MGLNVKIKINMTGWYVKSERVKRAIDTLKVWEIGPHNKENIQKARASINRQDLTYPISPAVLSTGQATLVQGLKAVATSRRTNVDKEMRAMGKAALEDVKANINGSKVTGPKRSEAWIRAKGQDINMVGLTRGPAKFVNALRMRLVDRDASAAQARAGSRLRRAV